MLSIVSQPLVTVSSSVIPEQRTLIFCGSVSMLSHCTSSISSYFTVFRGFLRSNWATGKAGSGKRDGNGNGNGNGRRERDRSDTE